MNARTRWASLDVKWAELEGVDWLAFESERELNDALYVKLRVAADAGDKERAASLRMMLEESDERLKRIAGTFKKPGRKAKRSSKDVDTIPDELSAPELIAEGFGGTGELSTLVREAIRRCSEKQREYIVCYFLMRKNVCEIAEETGINVSTVSRTIHRGLKNAGRYLELRLTPGVGDDLGLMARYLTKRQYEAAHLCLIEGLSVSAAAERLGVEKSTLSRTLKRAKNRLLVDSEYAKGVSFETNLRELARRGA